MSWGEYKDQVELPTARNKKFLLSVNSIISGERRNTFCEISTYNITYNILLPDFLSYQEDIGISDRTDGFIQGSVLNIQEVIRAVTADASKTRRCKRSLSFS